MQPVNKAVSTLRRLFDTQCVLYNEITAQEKGRVMRRYSLAMLNS